MLLGRVVKSNSHVDYVVQVFAPGEVANPPPPEHYAFGQFVRISADGDRAGLIGVIYDTLLLNPAYGTLGPHLSGEPELTAFAPDYLPETATVVGVAVVGYARGSGEQVAYQQGVPPIAGRVGSEVRLLSDDEFETLHSGEKGIQVKYLPRLGAMRNPAIPELLNGILTSLIENPRLAEKFPESAGTLSVLRSNLDWSARLGRG